MARSPKFTPEETEALVMRAAREEFSQYGFHAAHMQDIADASGVNKRVVYALVKDKDALYLAVLSEASREFEAAVESFWQNTQVKTASELYLATYDLLVAHPVFARLLTWEWMSETLQGMRLLTTVRTLRTRLHDEAARLDPARLGALTALDQALEAMVVRACLADGPSALNAVTLREHAKKIFDATC